MKTSARHTSALLAALLAAACSQTTPPATTPPDPAIALLDTAAHETPVFTDEGHTLDSLFAARGYKYGADIVGAAQGGNADARYILAQMYAYGVAGAPANARQAFQLYLTLADEGMPEAQAIAGYMLFYGLGTTEDSEEGLRLLALAANQDCGLAYYFLGNFYTNNAQPTPENLQYAKVCYAKAAALGISAAEEQLKSKR